MKTFAIFAVISLCLLVNLSNAKEDDFDDESKPKDSWWSGFKEKVKTVLSKWRVDLKLLWDEVLAKADDMKGWTSEVYDNFKKKMKEWLETRPEVPDVEKNEIETFISKLKIPTEKPADKPKLIEP